MADFYDYLDHLSDDAILNYAYMKNMQKHDPSLFSSSVMSGRTIPSYIPSTDRQVVPDHIWDEWTKATDIWKKEAAEAANKMWWQGTYDDPYYKQVQAYKTFPSYLPSTTKHVISDKEWFNTPKPPKKPVEPTLGNPNASHVGKGPSMNMGAFNYTPTHTQYNKGYDSGYNDVAKQVAYDKAKSVTNSNDSSTIIGNYYDNFGVNKSIPTPPTTNTTSQTPSDPMSNFNDTQKSYYNYLTGYKGLGHKQALNSMGITF